MAHKGRQYTLRKISRAQLEAERRSPLAIIWSIVGGFALVVGLFVTIYSLKPKIIVSVGEKLDNEQPFSTLFNISNDGLLTIHSVNRTCVVNEVETVDHAILSKTEFTSNKEGFINKLEPGEAVTTNCMVIYSRSRIIKADISVVISFHSAYWPFQLSKPYRFVGAMAKDGQIRWTTIPAIN
jgi:hypothetical protein